MIGIAATSCWWSVSADANRFVEAGIPASDRAWAGFDYARAADIFASGAVELPRLSDDLGRPLILRMTSLDNLRWQHDASLPLELPLTLNCLRNSFQRSQPSIVIRLVWMV
jgi:hypothetical protein